ncbi:L-ribulose-5-phosphate 3-epimerase [Bombilactobacillus mellis]|uniref:L-ribulose-5-phosphate 3-epimerase n=1 Tax=Bombilactobacillus mellis TaxID=1218508 RepID=UPI00157FF90F|nr:L-ribulose-5-phosphate 3-epimerase [Bombilactobacillus mellis]NUF25331.1 L-ribulose-5-phosphate 3-epimerase [Bombilactobacillus mellis]
MTVNALGIYEKALPPTLNWEQKFELVHELGFNFLEFSIDESDERLQRLNWSRKERSEFRAAMWKTHSRINTLMLSGHRRFPLGSADPQVREQALVMMQQAIDLAVDLGIRNIQLAGYDVYYEPKTVQSHELFLENLQKCVEMAAKKLVMLSIETMDDPFLNSLTKIAQVKKQIASPWLQAYPDLGNISAWPENDVINDLENNFAQIVAVHLKDTKKVTPTFKGQFKEVPFSQGDVDFLGCLMALKRLGYNGSYTVEMWTESAADPIAEVKKAKAFFTKLFNQAGIQQEKINE